MFKYTSINPYIQFNLRHLLYNRYGYVMIYLLKWNTFYVTIYAVFLLITVQTNCGFFMVTLLFMLNDLGTIQSNLDPEVFCCKIRSKIVSYLDKHGIW